MKRVIRAWFCAGVMGVAGLQANAAVLRVDSRVAASGDGTTWPAAKKTLVEALNAAQAGDEIWVAVGTYRPTSDTDRSISLQMKSGVSVYGGFAGIDAETTRAQRNWHTNVTTLSGDIGTQGGNTDNSYHVVKGANDATLDGFTVTRGNATVAGSEIDDRGGGMLNSSVSPAVANCIFIANTVVGAGGGMCNLGASPTVSNCAFVNNDGGTVGGGMYNRDASPTVTNCIFVGNFVPNSPGASGGGVFNYTGTSTVLRNCTFYGNTGYAGGGMGSDASPTVTNCVFWGDTGTGVPEIYGTSTITYSNVQGGYAGTGNINSDPLFVNAANGNFHLQATSPCIDAGFGDASTPATDIDGNPRYDDPGVANTGAGTPNYVDMGAYEVVSAATVPTLSQWGIIVLTLGLAAAAVWKVRAARVAA